MTERPSRRERTSPAPTRSPRWPESVLCGTFRRRAASPAGMPLGPASTRGGKAARRVGLERAESAERAEDSLEAVDMGQAELRFVNIIRHIDGKSRGRAPRRWAPRGRN